MLTLLADEGHASVRCSVTRVGDDCYCAVVTVIHSTGFAVPRAQGEGTALNALSAVLAAVLALMEPPPSTPTEEVSIKVNDFPDQGYPLP